jgi:hypothetical protein
VRVQGYSLLTFTRPMKMEQTECPATSAYKIQTPWNHPKERIKNWNLYLGNFCYVLVTIFIPPTNHVLVSSSTLSPFTLRHAHILVQLDKINVQATAYSDTKNLVFQHDNNFIITVNIHDRPTPNVAVEWMSPLINTFGGPVFELRSWARLS